MADDKKERKIEAIQCSGCGKRMKSKRVIDNFMKRKKHIKKEIKNNKSKYIVPVQAVFCLLCKTGIGLAKKKQEYRRKMAWIKRNITMAPGSKIVFKSDKGVK